MKNLPKIIDNNRKKLADVLIETASQYSDLSVATGYWDIEGMKLIINSIQDYSSVRILIGREPLLKRDNKNEIEEPEPDYPDKDFFDDLQRINPTSELKEVVIKMKELIDNNKLEVRVYRRSFLHAKCYIFGNYDSSENIGIIGSSNFTRNGMTSNSELNALENDGRLIRTIPKNKDQEIGHLYWFDELWKDEKTEEWTGKFTELIDSSKVGEHIFSPYEMYIHSLYQTYKDELSTDISITDDAKEVLHAFQVRNAEILLKKLHKNNIAMLADSVGLGKTITGGAVIKKYINDPDNKKPRIEVIVPASLRSQWITELATHHDIIEGIDNVHISSLHNAGEIEDRKNVDKYRPVDLFVIDEAHNLRNESSERYKDLLEWIQNNEDSHVLLMTATPINNQLTDFASQINLASGGREDLFFVQIPKMGGRQQTIKEHYDAIRDLTGDIKKDLKNGKEVDTSKIKIIMRPILQHFMVRSTRTGIEREFGGVLDKNGNLIKFPKAYSKEERYYFTDSGISFTNKNDLIPLEKMLSKDIDSIIENKQLTKHPLDLLDQFKESSNSDINPVHKIFLLTTYLGLPIYRTALYKHEFYGKDIELINEILSGSKKKREEKFEIKQQMSMHNMMRILYLKRAESSVYALKRSLEYYLERLNSFEKFLEEDNKLVKISNLKDYASSFDNDLDAGDIENNTKSISIEADIDIFDIEQLKLDIQKDRNILAVILPILEDLILNDKKLEHFSDLLQKFKEEGKKVLVFSYFSDTVEFLENNITKKCPFLNEKNTAFTTDKTKRDVEDLAKRFSPKSKRYELESGETELQFLFSTDVLSEGQNLQDCPILINYDLHWNPVRMIQRNGRINRLGGEHEEVFIYNLCPANEIEAYLKLEMRLKQKIEMIKHSIGTDQSILGEEANAIEFTDDIQFDNSKKIFDLTKQIYDSNIDVNDIIKEFEEETDILATEDVFIADLRNFDNTALPEEKERIYHRIPLGKWGSLPLKADYGDISDVLAHSLVNIQDKGINQEMPIFVSLPRDGRTISFVDKLEALQALQTHVDSKNIKINFGKFNEDNIENILNQRLIQIAEQSIVRPENNLKPSHEIALDYLHEINQPTHLIQRVLKEHRNRTDRKYITNRLMKIYFDIKENKPLNQKILSELVAKSSKINLKLDDQSDNKPMIVGDPIIYSYHAKV